MSNYRYRVCRACGTRKPLTVKNYYRRDGRYGHVCNVCHNARSRANYRKRKADPVAAARERAMNAERQRRYRRRDGGAAERERCRVYRARIAANAARQAEVLQDARIRVRLAKGNDVRPPVRATATIGAYEPPVMTGHTGPMLDVEPLAAWLSHRFGDLSTKELSARLGVDEATVRRVRTRAQRKISLHIADRMFVNALEPQMLAILYPLPDEELRAA